MLRHGTMVSVFVVSFPYVMLGDISGFHGGEYEDISIVGYDWRQ
jgi:hypothetical protein